MATERTLAEVLKRGLTRKQIEAHAETEKNRSYWDDKTPEAKAKSEARLDVLRQAWKLSAAVTVKAAVGNQLPLCSSCRIDDAMHGSTKCAGCR